MLDIVPSADPLPDLLPDPLLTCSGHTETGYKYLGILEANDIKHEQMKDKITKEYVKRVKKIASSKLNSGNTIDAINSRAVSLVRYGAGIIGQGDQGGTEEN